MITTLLCALMALLLCLMNARAHSARKAAGESAESGGALPAARPVSSGPDADVHQGGTGRKRLDAGRELFEHTARRTFEFKRALCGSNRPPLMLGAALAAEAVCKRGKIGEKERAALTLVLGGAAAALAATSFSRGAMRWR